VKMDGLGGLARRAKKAATISSMCVVFAESEVIGLLARKVPRGDIVAGIQRSLATRVISLTGGKLTPPVVFTGGVAMISGMAGALAREAHGKVKVVKQPVLTGALGAAILAARG
jgi:activator of 2-hydroxyglutaryl-CoA dehydratase